MSTNLENWRNAVSDFLAYVLNVKYENLPSFNASLYEYYCYVNRGLDLFDAGYTLSAADLSSGIFRVHYHPGDINNASHIRAIKPNTRQPYRLYLNVSIEAKKSGIEHAPDISIFLWLPPRRFGYQSANKLVAICECKMKKLKLGDVREFLGYRVELTPADKAHQPERHIRSFLFSTFPIPGNLLQISDEHGFEIEQLE